MDVQRPHNQDMHPVPTPAGRSACEPRPSGAASARSARFGVMPCTGIPPDRPDSQMNGGLSHNSAMTDDQTTSGPGQLVYSLNGLFVVHSEAGHWVVPPATVLKLLPGLAYSIRKGDQVSVRSITLSDMLSQKLGFESRLYRLTPLLRELLESLSTTPVGKSESTDSKALLLVDLLTEAGMWRDETKHRCRSMPSDPRVAHICDYIYDNLDAPRTLQEWADELNNDTRTLHRLFIREFGMSFVQWRQQTRLMAALEWLAEGRPIMDVALDLGYQTQSAFAAMFRRNTGITPSEWQEKRRSCLAR